MYYINNFTYKPFRTKDDVRAMAAAFAGPQPGVTVIAAYQRVDGKGGTIIGKVDDIATAYRGVLEASEWFEFDIQIVLPEDEAKQQVTDYLST